MIISQTAASKAATIQSKIQEDQNIRSILLPEHSLGLNYSDLNQADRSLSITNLFYKSQIKNDGKGTSSQPLLVCSSPLPIHSSEKSPKTYFDLNPHNSTVYKNRLYLETSFDVNPSFSDTRDTGNSSETLCLEGYESSINLNPNFCRDYSNLPCPDDGTNFQLQPNFEQNLRARSYIDISDLDVKGVTVGGEIVNIELPEGTSSVLGVWTLGLGLLGDSESVICC